MRFFILLLLFALTSPSTLSAAALEADTVADEIAKHEDIYFIGISEKDFESTLADLKHAIKKRGFTIFTEIDHAEGAQKAGLELAPTHLILFGNPKGGTPLMQENRFIGMELPLKAMVHAQDDHVIVTMLRIEHFERPFGLQAKTDVIQKITQVQKAMMLEATSATQP